MKRRIGGAGGGSDPGPKGGKKVVAAAVAVGALAGTGGVTGTFSTSSAGGTSTGEAAVSRSIKARKAEGRNAAKKGNGRQAWKRMGLRTIREAARNDLDCVANSFDAIRKYFLQKPCASLDRMLFAVGDDRGGSVVISVAWVGFRDRSTARRFRSLIDEHGNGDVKPLAGSLLKIADVRFSGLNYQSRIQSGKTVVIAETEQLRGDPDKELLDAVADVAALLPRPGGR